MGLESRGIAIAILMDNQIVIKSCDRTEPKRKKVGQNCGKSASNFYLLIFPEITSTNQFEGLNMKEIDSNQFKNQLIVLIEAANTCPRPCAVVQGNVIKYHNRVFKRQFGLMLNQSVETLSASEFEVLNIPFRTYGGFSTFSR